MRIIGAGMAGLLAANVLRRHKPVVYEQKSSLPLNHSALLRFRTEAVSRATGIPFRKVIVHKAVVDESGNIHHKANIKMSNQYAQKVVGRIISRSILSLDSAERFIAPNDFVEQMAACVDIRFDTPVNFEAYKPEYGPSISTIPMPVLMEQLDWNKQTMPLFESKPVWVLSAEILDPTVDVYQTLYFSDPELPLYRASITGNRIIMEFLSHPDLGPRGIDWCLRMFGIRSSMMTDETISVQRYGKITPIDESIRKNFIFTTSEQRHIYSLGRFATWRQILLDDLVDDISFIESFIVQRDLYSAQKSIIR